MNERPSMIQTAAMVVLLFSALQLAHGQTADEPGGDPNPSHPDHVLTA